LPTRIIDHRESDLEARFEHLQEEAERFSELTISSAFDEYFSNIRSAFEKIDSRRSDVEANPDNDALYQRYLSKVISAEADISDLELVLTHLDLYTHHRDRWPDRIQHVEEICEELTDAFGLSVTCFPVIRENYALLPLLDDDFYVIYVPRGRSLVPTTPILAHEVAHALLDQRSSRSHEFNQRFSELRRQMDHERTERDFHGNWSHWYSELFCDVAGFFAFGPSYVCAQLHHLLSRNPYFIQRDVGVEDDTLHPPDALRVTVITDLADEYLPKQLREPLEDIRAEYTQHLQCYEESKRPFYDEWADDELVNAVISDAAGVNTQFDQLCSHIQNGSDPSDVPEFEFRLKANRYWLDEN
jgi:hypothetical protein